jgi:heme/copper-type cytochrome/quinol oxidase subunit 4
MNTTLALVLGIAVGLLLLAGGRSVVLAFGVSNLVPLPAKPAQEEEKVELVDEKALAARKVAYRLGIYVLIGLAVLTAVEYAVAVVLDGSVGLLFILALAKAGIILQYFMHLNSVWSEEEAH